MGQFEKYKKLFMFEVREASVATGIDLATNLNYNGQRLRGYACMRLRVSFICIPYKNTSGYHKKYISSTQMCISFNSIFICVCEALFYFRLGLGIGDWDYRHKYCKRLQFERLYFHISLLRPLITKKLKKLNAELYS